MSLLSYLPLVLALAVLAAVSCSPFVTPLDRIFSRLSLHLFRDIIERFDRKQSERVRLLQAAHSTTTYTVFATKTVLYSLVGGLVTLVIGAYAGFAALSYLLANREAVKAALPSELHFVIEPAPTANPLSALSGTTGTATGGTAVPLDVPAWLVDLVPSGLVRTLGGIWQAIPQPIKPSLPTIRGGAGGGAVEQVQILIVFPDFGVIPDSLAMLSPLQFAMLFIGALWLGLIGASTVYALRWHDVRSKANQRAVLIDESFVRTISFVYALSRSGMLFPEIMRTVARNREAFGETAEELSVAVKEMDLFGSDVITALDRTTEWTPSDQFSDFLKNFANVLKSGQHVPNYLRERYEQAQQERVANQEQLLEYFTALGEAYVAILVAGPLFLITILTIFGILTGGQLVLLQLMIYLAIPIANFGFIAYLGSIGQALSSYQVPERQVREELSIAVRRSSGTERSRTAVADGGVAVVEENLRRLRIYNRLRPLRWAVKYPIETVTSKPLVILYVMMPLAVGSILVRWWLHGGGVTVTTADDWLVQAALLVTGSFAIAQEIHTRRLRRIEAMVPDFLDSLASANEAGRTFTESLKRIGATDFGGLSHEFDRLLADIEWGARTEEALHRFSARIRSPTVARVVALLTNALRASDQIGPVIRIAAEEARKDRSLKKKRRQEMLMYVLIVYVSFAVFIGITIALKTVLIPAVPSADQLGDIANSGSLGISVIVSSAGEVQKDQYTLLLFHAAAVQGFVSGLVAGKMGEGSVKNGAKHATILLLGAYALFYLFG